MASKPLITQAKENFAFSTLLYFLCVQSSSTPGIFEILLLFVSTRHTPNQGSLGLGLSSTSFWQKKEFP
jgi:hypothetical protein